MKEKKEITVLEKVCLRLTEIIGIITLCTVALITFDQIKSNFLAWICTIIPLLLAYATICAMSDSKPVRK